MNKMRGNKLSLLSFKLMNKMRGNKLVLLSSKLKNKIGRTHILSLLFLDGLPMAQLALYLYCYENHCNGHFSKMAPVWAPNGTKLYFGLKIYFGVFSNSLLPK